MTGVYGLGPGHVLIEYLDCGKFDRKVSAIGPIRGDINGPLVQGDDPVSQGQTQSETADIRCLRPTIEWLKDLGDLLHRDNGPPVDHFYVDLMKSKAQVYHRPFVRGIFAAIFDDILDGDIEQLAIAEDHEVFFVFGEFTKIQFHAVFGIELFDIADHLHEDLVDPDLVELEAALRTRLGDLQQALGQQPHLLYVLSYRGQYLLIFIGAAILLQDHFHLA